MKLRSYIIIIIIIIAGFVILKPEQPQVEVVNQGVSQVTVSEFATLLESGEYQVIDLRTPEEIAEGKVTPDALEIDYFAEDFRDQLQTLDLNANYLVYCKAGGRSGKSLEIFQELGFINVKDLEGGITAWNDVVKQ
jgi:phage shock protein E